MNTTYKDRVAAGNRAAHQGELRQAARLFEFASQVDGMINEHILMLERAHILHDLVEPSGNPLDDMFNDYRATAESDNMMWLATLTDEPVRQWHDAIRHRLETSRAVLIKNHHAVAADRVDKALTRFNDLTRVTA